MTRIMAKLFAVAIVLTAFLPVQPSSAAGVAFVSATGGGSACTQAAPCSSMITAINSLGGTGGRIVCITAVLADAAIGFNESYVFDCPSTIWPDQFDLSGSNVELKFQHMSFSGAPNGVPMVRVTGSGTLIFDDCDFENITGTALDIEPSGPLTLVVTNSRISNNVSGVLIKPAAGGSVIATFDGVTIINNAGGGLRIDTTNGPVAADISNSSISNNSGNGVNAVGPANQNIVSIKNSVIAKNGVAGMQANGVNAGALVQTTLFDQNATGATSVVNGGHISTYGNNSIVGAFGSGFTGSASLQ